MHAAVSIIHAQQLVTTAIERALKPLELTFARYEVLMLLSFSKLSELPITKIGERLMVHPTGITKLVDKLEAQGLVQRVPHPTDRRGTLVRLTRTGLEVGTEATEVLTQLRFGMPLDDPAAEKLIDLLQRLRSSAGATDI